jgi:hypothetical protein
MNERWLRRKPGRRNWDLLTLGGVGLLSALAWLASAGAGTGHGPHGSHGEGGLEEGSERHFAGHGEFHGFPFPILYEFYAFLSPGEPDAGPFPPGLFFGGMGEAGQDWLTSEHHEGPAGDLIPGHHAGPADHHHAHVHRPYLALLLHAGQVEIHQQVAQTGGDSDDAGAATAQPDPTANPSFQHPPGANGPGRRAFGWLGPGRTGPGERTRPRQ